MHREPLTADPARPAPQDALAGFLLGHLGDGLLVEQRVEVVDLPPRPTIVEPGVQRHVLAEIRLEHGDTFLQP